MYSLNYRTYKLFSRKIQRRDLKRSGGNILGLGPGMYFRIQYISGKIKFPSQTSFVYQSIRAPFLMNVS